MSCKLFPLKKIAATKVAVDVCNTPDLKKEILCTSESAYSKYLDKNPQQKNTGTVQRFWEQELQAKGSSVIDSIIDSVKIPIPCSIEARGKIFQEVCHESVQSWQMSERKNEHSGISTFKVNGRIFQEVCHESVPSFENESQEEKAQFFPIKIKTKIVEYIQAVSLRMLAWGKYHKNFLGVNSYEHIVNYLKPSFFNMKGKIDSQRIALDLVDDKRFTEHQRYKLACLYCLEQPIEVLLEEIPAKLKQAYRVKASNVTGVMQQRGLLVFWTSLLSNPTIFIANQKRLWTMVRNAFASGNEVAFKYFLKKLDEKNHRKNRFKWAKKALETIKEMPDFSSESLSCENKLSGCYYLDMIYFLLPQMQVNEKRAFSKVFNELIGSISDDAPKWCKKIKESLLEVTPTETETKELSSENAVKEIYYLFRC